MLFLKYQWLICLCARGVILNDKWYNEQPWTWFQHKVSFLNHDVTKNLTGHRMHKEGSQRYQMNRQTNITKTYTSKSPILCARIWFTWLCKALDGLFLGSLEFNGSNYRVSQKKVYNKIFSAQGMEFLGRVTGRLEQCATIDTVSIVAHCSKGLVTLLRNSIPFAE